MTTFNYFENCEYLEVDHLNGDKSNNNISNLEWVTGKENVNRAIANNLRKSWIGNNNPNCKYNENDVRKVIELALEGKTDYQINQITNISIGTIRIIVKGKIGIILFLNQILKKLI